MNLLECQHITKKFNNFKALDNVSITLKKGKVYGLLGPNGSGKTTLIKIINNLLTKDTGTILIKGKSNCLDSKNIIAYLPDTTYLDFNMTTTEVINYFKDFYADFRVNVANKLLKELKIDTTKPLKKMSKGTKEKVELIMVMSRKAELYILDEPIGGVDPASREYIIKTILDNFASNASILISTHLISDIEKILDEVIFLKDGKVLLQENCDELRSKENISIDEIFREEFKC